MFQKILCPPKVDRTLSLSPSLDSVMLHTFIDFSTTTGHHTQWFIMIQFQYCDMFHVILSLYKIKQRPSKVWTYSVSVVKHTSRGSSFTPCQIHHIPYNIHCFSAVTHFIGCFTNSRSNTFSVFHYLGFQICDMLQVLLNYSRSNAFSSFVVAGSDLLFSHSVISSSS